MKTTILRHAGSCAFSHSLDPMRKIGKVLRKHIDRTTREKVIEDLQDVPGNKAFRDAVESLSHELLKP